MGVRPCYICITVSASAVSLVRSRTAMTHLIQDYPQPWTYSLISPTHYPPVTQTHTLSGSSEGRPSDFRCRRSIFSAKEYVEVYGLPNCVYGSSHPVVSCHIRINIEVCLSVS
jgi:hypothetical protein